MYLEAEGIWTEISLTCGKCHHGNGKWAEVDEYSDGFSVLQMITDCFLILIRTWQQFRNCLEIVPSSMLFSKARGMEIKIVGMENEIGQFWEP